jgi:hypothetical protein
MPINIIYVQPGGGTRTRTIHILRYVHMKVLYIGVDAYIPTYVGIGVKLWKLLSQTYLRWNLKIRTYQLRRNFESKHFSFSKSSSLPFFVASS